VVLDASDLRANTVFELNFADKRCLNLRVLKVILEFVYREVPNLENFVVFLSEHDNFAISTSSEDKLISYRDGVNELGVVFEHVFYNTIVPSVNSPVDYSGECFFTVEGYAANSLIKFTEQTIF
jgi:hypothetical protein